MFLAVSRWSFLPRRSPRNGTRLFQKSAATFQYKQYETRKVTARGIEFQVSIRNPNAPHAVLCLPGALGTGPSDFPQLLETGLMGDEQFGIFALDARGMGGSISPTYPKRDFPLDFYRRDALDAVAVMEALGRGDKYSVLGWSDGAIVAVHLAAILSEEEKKSIQNLVIWGGNAFVSKADVDTWESLRDVRNSWSERVRSDKARIHGGIDRLQELNEAAVDGWSRLYFQKAGDACLAELHQVSCPTLVLHGAKDFICDLSHAQYMSRHIRNARLVILEDGKHNLHQRYSDTFHRIVRSFLLDSTQDDDDKTEALLPLPIKEDEQGQQPDIEEIDFAFLESKSLSIALHAGLFDAIHQLTIQKGLKDTSLKQIESKCSIQGEQLRTLLSACVALKLIRRGFSGSGQETLSLTRASAKQLVSSSRNYMGDYVLGLLDGLFYKRMEQGNEPLLLGATSGSAHYNGYDSWFESDPLSAEKYTRAQHKRNLITGLEILKRLPELTERESLCLLDVGGGSGAFSMAIARKLRHASCTVLDVPNVLKVTQSILDEEKDSSVRRRVSTIAMSTPTIASSWQEVVEEGVYDVVLMSYVSGTVAAQTLPVLYENAMHALIPGGLIVIHDYLVDNNGQGPKCAALWTLANVASAANPEGMCLQPHHIVHLLSEKGFIAPRVHDLIPSARTQLVVATKPVQQAAACYLEQTEVVGSHIT